MIGYLNRRCEAISHAPMIHSPMAICARCQTIQNCIDEETKPLHVELGRVHTEHALELIRWEASVDQWERNFNLNWQDLVKARAHIAVLETELKRLNDTLGAIVALVLPDNGPCDGIYATQKVGSDVD